jgi:tetratricopeptide (TPR) repeat protein
MSKKKSPPAKPQNPPLINTQRWPVDTPANPLLKKIFAGVAAVMLLIMLLVAPQTGINGDDEFQYDYSQKLVSYYKTFGQDTAALYIEKGNMHNYGGLFDLVSGLANDALGNDVFDTGYHQVRHVFIALFGFSAMLFIGLFVVQLAGWEAGLVALLLAFLSPRFFGHAMMNPKDIPFAAGFAISLYYMLRLLRSMPEWRWHEVIGLTLGMAIAIATRAGGLLLIAYWGLFAGLDFLGKYGWGGLFKDAQRVLRYAGLVLGVSVTAYALAVLSWPAAIASPLSHPFQALAEFSQLGIKIRLLFEGSNVMSDKVAWYYPVLWMVKTIPLTVLLGSVGAILIMPIILKRYAALPYWLAVFASLFPIVYIIYKDAILHDGWRHLMFVYPSLVALAALFWYTMSRQASTLPYGKYAIYGLAVLMTLDAAAFMSKNPRLSYVYFNPIGGGLRGALGNYELDYWGVGVKNALDWMEKEGIIGENMTDTVVIGTTFFYPLHFQATGKYKGMVKPVYVRYGQRYTERWDYGIFPSRFFRGPHLRAGTWPNSKSVHVIRANGVPIVAIEKDEQNFAWQGDQASKVMDWETAISSFNKEVARHQDNELAWQGLANAYLNTGKFDESVAAAEASLKIAPDDEQSLFYLGLAYLNKNDGNNAALALQRCIKVNEESPFAHYYLALVYQATGDIPSALRHAVRAVELNGRFRQGYELAATLYENSGDPNTAAAYRNAAAQLP